MPEVVSMKELNARALRLIEKMKNERSPEGRFILGERLLDEL